MSDALVQLLKTNLVLCTYLRVEVEERPDVHGQLEHDVIHVHDEGPLLGVDESVGKGQFKSLPHDEAAKDLVEAISVLRLTDDDVLEFGVLHPSGVFGQDACFEGERLVIHGLNEELVDEGLLLLGGRMLEQ